MGITGKTHTGADKEELTPEYMDILEGKHIAIVAMGQSQLDFHLSKIHSVKFDEVWAINAMIGILSDIDRAFILDPMSRFLDTEDAGGMTNMMREKLPKANYPIYSCELDERVPAVEEYPLSKVIRYTGSAYLNNTVAYAIAYALCACVDRISIFGVDFTYKTNMHFAEAGRGCVEFWLAKCISEDIKIGISPRSTLLDTNIDLKDKLYGYHRLDNPSVAYQNNEGELNVCSSNDIKKQGDKKPVGIIGRNDLTLVEPVKF
jgi:hypothetical protein